MEILADVLAVTFTLHFFWSYYWNCFRKGYTVDLWHFMLLILVFSIHIMLPFSRSPLNVYAVGNFWPRIAPQINEAYLITALGYAMLLAGGNVWRINLGLGTRRAVASVLEFPARGSLLLLNSKTLLLTHGALSVAVLAGVIAIYFSLSGFGFNIEGLLVTYPPFRPIAQFGAFYSVLIGSHCMARYVVRKERSMLLVVLVIAAELLFFGQRSTLLSLGLLTIMVGFIKLGRRLKMRWFAVGGFLVVVLVFLLNVLRHGDFQLNHVLLDFGMQTFYGNSFSDTRDFAWMLGFWKGDYYHGLTYLAAIISFIPRALSNFRDTYALGVVTATTIGFEPTTHAGIRLGPFGEAYINFGLPGVVVSGLFVGAITRLIDERIKQAVRVLPPQSLRAYSYYIVMTFAAVAEISITASLCYSILVIFALSWVYLRVVRVLNMQTVGT